MNFAEICADSGRFAVENIPQRGWPLTAMREPWRIPARFRIPLTHESPATMPPSGPRLPAPGTGTRRLYDIMAASRGTQFAYPTLCALMNRPGEEFSVSSSLAALKRHDLVKSEGNHLRMLWWVP